MAGGRMGSGTPKFKVFDGDGVYQASCKELEACAALVALYGEGSTIRWGHAKRDTLFTQGVDGDAGESYDLVVMHCADVLDRRLEATIRARKRGD